MQINQSATDPQGVKVTFNSSKPPSKCIIRNLEEDWKSCQLFQTVPRVLRILSSCVKIFVE